ncbi:acyl carrier protein [bacterium]|nr:acyl carrier protein [bacterium]
MAPNIEQTLDAFIREHCLPRNSGITIGKHDNLFETGTIDSAGLLHFIGYIEDTFDIVIPDEDLIPEQFSTLASIENYIHERVRQPVAAK